MAGKPAENDGPVHERIVISIIIGIALKRKQVINFLKEINDRI